MRVNPNNRRLKKETVVSILNKLEIRAQVHNLEYYQRAFTHKSYATKETTPRPSREKPDDFFPTVSVQNASNERYAFLGNSIINSAVTKYICKRFHRESGARISNLRSKIVKESAIATLAEYLGFGKLVLLSYHLDESRGGRRLKSVLCGCFEAFVAAIYFDNPSTTTTDAAEDFVVKAIESYMNLPDMLIEDTNYKDALRKHFQKRFKDSPRYKSDGTADPNTHAFVVTVHHIDDRVIGTGTGLNKKEAEQQAARDAIQRMG
jgi:ribonuclease-3